MSFALSISVVVVSVVLATYLLLRQANQFAQKPPAPLIDMDRMYDVLFTKLDAETGSKVTPNELEEILQTFIKVLSQHNLIHESVAEQAGAKDRETKLTSAEIAKEIKELKSHLDVDIDSIEVIVDQSFNYLAEINAIITEG